MTKVDKLLFLGAVGVGVAMAADAAAAQDRIAMLSGVQGTVLVTRADGMSAAVNGQSLGAGARVTTTHGSAATIVYDNGCHEVMGQDARATVQSDADCAALKPEPIRLAQASGAIGGGSAPSPEAVGDAGGSVAGTIGTVGTVGTVGALGYGLYHVFKHENQATSVSPN
ncbi:MAG: hypothetical protein ACYC9Z_01630 [Casimicrobiaceae bacterium]